jgi:histidine triad (HIT) family protein
VSASDCIFCKIASGEIPATALHRDERVLAIADVNPQAPVHLLVMPVAHADDIGGFLDAANAADVAHLFAVAAKLGREHGGEGYRLVINTGDDGGQTVGHLHVHVLAGRHMTWPPG